MIPIGFWASLSKACHIKKELPSAGQVCRPAPIYQNPPPHLAAKSHPFANVEGQVFQIDATNGAARPGAGRLDPVDPVVSMVAVRLKIERLAR